MVVDPTRVLVVGPSWVGDMVMAQSLFKAIKQHQPDTLIDVLAPSWSRPLLARMPEINASIDMPVGHGKLLLKTRYQLGKSLRGRYQQTIVLPNSLKSALVPFFADIPLRTGWRGEMRYVLLNDIRLLDKQRYPLMVQRFVALAYDEGQTLPEQLPYPQLNVNVERIPELLQRFELSGFTAQQSTQGLSFQRKRPLLVLCPGAEFGPAKRWPEQHYAAVASVQIAAGWQVWLLGSNKDRAVAESIRDLLPSEQRQHSVNLAGITELEDAIDLMSLADAVVSNDSGLMHIAAALQRPLVVVYGSTSPDFTPPLAEDVRIASIPVDCGPCFQRECPQQHMKCLNELDPARVLDLLRQLQTVHQLEVC